MNMSLKLELGRCYEFTLVSGTKVRLRFYGDYKHPQSGVWTSRWRDEECNFLYGDLNSVLGEALKYSDAKQIKCWDCSDYMANDSLPPKKPVEAGQQDIINPEILVNKDVTPAPSIITHNADSRRRNDDE